MSKKIEEQIRINFCKAFFDSVDENINSENPDYEWISKLYSEIKQRILKIVKKDSKTYNLIDEQFDIVIFEQMIKNDVFDFDSLFNLINNTFDWIKKLQSPARDEETEKSRQKVLQSEPKHIVSNFICEIHKCIDYIEEDLVNFYNNF